MPRHLLIAPTLTLVAGLTVGTLRYLGVAFVDAGPLGGPVGAEIGARELAGEVFAVPFLGTTNTTSEPLRLESVDVGRVPRGLRLVGVGVCEAGKGGCFVATSYPGWPPRSFDLHDVEGYTVAPRADFVVIAGFEAEHPGTYDVRLEVTYREGLRRFVAPLSSRVRVLVE